MLDAGKDKGLPQSPWLRLGSTEGSVLICVRVTPRASRDGIDGVVADALRVRLQAPPVEGRANAALCRLLAERLNVPQSAVRIVAGEHSRLKRLEVRGVSLERVLQLAAAGPR